MRWIVIVIAVILGSGAALGQTVDRNLLMKDFIGKTWKWQNGEIGGTVRYYPNGAVKLTTSLKDIPEDLGVWTFRGDKLCTRYQKLRKGQERCFTFTKVGRNRFEDDGGTVAWR